MVGALLDRGECDPDPPAATLLQNFLQSTGTQLTFPGLFALNALEPGSVVAVSPPRRRIPNPTDAPRVLPQLPPQRPLPPPSSPARHLRLRLLANALPTRH